MNKVILTGRLTRDPEVRYTQGSEPRAVARFGLAVRKKWRKEGEPEADFPSCVAFGKSAEWFEKYCKKGTKVEIVGRIQTGSYTDKSGQKVYTTEVVVEEQEFAESKSAQGGNSDGGDRDTNAPAPMPQDDNGFMTVPDDAEDLPFK